MPDSIASRPLVPRLVLVAALAMAAMLAAVAPAHSAASKPDFRVAVPSRGDVTVAVVKLRGPKLPAKRRDTRKRGKERDKRGQRRRGGPRLRVLSGRSDEVAVLGGVTGERVGNRRVYTALVTVARPKRAGKRASAAVLPGLIGIGIDSFLIALNLERADRLDAAIRAQLEAMRESNARVKQKVKELIAQQKMIAEARVEGDDAKRRQAAELMVQILEAIRRVELQRLQAEKEQRQQQRETERQQLLRKLAELLERQSRLNQKLDESRPPEVEVLKKEQAKNAIQNPIEMKKVLDQTSSKVIHKLEDAGGGKKLDTSAMKKVLEEAKKQPPQGDPSGIAEHIEKSLELLKQCLAGGKPKSCAQQPDKPKQPEKPQKPVEQPKPPVPLPPAPPPMLPTPPASELDVELTHAEVPDYGWFYCVHVSTDPPQPGAQGVYGHKQLGGDSDGSGGTFVLDADGKTTIVFERFDPKEGGFWTMVALDWPGLGPVSRVFEGPGFGSEVAPDECAPPWIGAD